jgi:clan AA aspartic protease (TIGR02281 family)
LEEELLIMKKILLIIIVSLIIFGTGSAAFGENSPLENTDDRFLEYEKIMERYFRGEPREAAFTKINSRIDEYNTWATTSRKKLEVQRENLNHELGSTDTVRKQIDELDEQLTRIPDPTDEKAVKAYNVLMNKRNTLVDKYNGLLKAYKEKETAFDSAVRAFDSEAKFRQEKLEEQKQHTTAEANSIDLWFKEKNDRAFFEDLNRTYAELVEEKKRTGTSEQDAFIEKAKSLRHELGEHARLEQEKAENGLMIVRAALGASLESHFVVDTGATLVTVTPEIVRILGIADQAGQEIETSLAAGITARGREIIIPKLTVSGQAAQNIKAVIVPSGTVGADGLLGRSFLKQFIVRIDDESEPKLLLEKRAKR